MPTHPAAVPLARDLRADDARGAQRPGPPGRPERPPLPGGEATPAADVTLPTIALLLLVQARSGATPWLLSRLVKGASMLAGTPGLRFTRVLGSGHQGGFGLRPGFDRGGLFLMFDDEREADAFLAASPVLAVYREHAAELLTAKLRATSCRGSWGGMSIAVTARADPAAPLAALTRASIRPSRAWAFWRHAAPSQHALADVAGCRLAAGLGEAPLLRQATFSVWDDLAAMDAYARHGPHQQAIVAAAREGYFSETMFVRFVPLLLQGRWQGRTHG
jgi:spheroidene monooxygenase